DYQTKDGTRKGPSFVLQQRNNMTLVIPERLAIQEQDPTGSGQDGLGQLATIGSIMPDQEYAPGVLDVEREMVPVTASYMHDMMQVDVKVPRRESKFSVQEVPAEDIGLPSRWEVFTYRYVDAWQRANPKIVAAARRLIDGTLRITRSLHAS